MAKRRARKGADQPKRVRGLLREGWRNIWRTMVAGLLVWLPLIITVWVTWFFVNRFVLGIERQIKTLFLLMSDWGLRHSALAFLSQIQYVHGFGLFLTVALFYMTGILTRHFVGQRIIALGERVVHVIPFVNRVYRAVTQIRDTFIGRQGTVFQRVCLIEFPRKDLYAVAFITSDESGPIQQTLDRSLIAVFMPTTPNPTSGYLMYLPPEDVIELDISVEEAMKLIVSGGAYLPHHGERRDAEKPEEGAAEPSSATPPPRVAPDRAPEPG